MAVHMLSENSSKRSAAGGTDELQMGWQRSRRSFAAASPRSPDAERVNLRQGEGKAEVLHQQLRDAS